MNLLNKLRSLLLPESKPPSKLSNKQVVVPRYIGKARGAKIPNKATDTTSLDRVAFSRGAGSINAVIANLVRVSPDLSQAVATKIASGISKSYTVIAYDEMGRVDEKGTQLAQALVMKMDCQAPDYSRFQRSTDLRSTSASLLLDALRYGGMGAELVLGQGRQPSHIRPFSTNLISWAADVESTYPIYAAEDGPLELNFPTIFYSATAQDNESAYAESPMQSAIQACLWDIEFTDALRKAATKNLLTRLAVTIDSEKWLATLPLEITSDSEKMKQAALDTVAQVEDQLNGLNPEDCLVLFDSLSADTLADSNRSEDRSIEVLKDLINGQISSGSRTLPSILGRGQSSSAASSESQLFLKSVSAMQAELDSLYSRIFTLAVRLFGLPVNVKFQYADVNLKPEIELESFKTVKQSRIFDQLSIGMVTDIEASIMCTGTLPPVGYKNVSGTYFKVGAIDSSQNDYSNTSATTDGKPDSDQTTKNNKSDSPTGVPGRNPKK